MAHIRTMMAKPMKTLDFKNDPISQFLKWRIILEYFILRIELIYPIRMLV